ncbi:hypothetical protein ABPG75_004272 [Micractinium tetrahymenae]
MLLRPLRGALGAAQAPAPGEETKPLLLLLPAPPQKEDQKAPGTPEPRGAASSGRQGDKAAVAAPPAGGGMWEDARAVEARALAAAGWACGTAVRTVFAGLEACLLALICCALWIARSTSRTCQSAAAAFHLATSGLRRRAAAAKRRAASRAHAARAAAARAGRWLAEPVAIKRGEVLAAAVLTIGATLLAAAALAIAVRSEGPGGCYGF